MNTLMRRRRALMAVQTKNSLTQITPGNYTSGNTKCIVASDGLVTLSGLTTGRALSLPMMQTFQLNSGDVVKVWHEKISGAEGTKKCNFSIYTPTTRLAGAVQYSDLFNTEKTLSVTSSITFTGFVYSYNGSAATDTFADPLKFYIHASINDKQVI